jgi:hypothetical protein
MPTVTTVPDSPLSKAFLVSPSSLLDAVDILRMHLVALLLLAVVLVVVWERVVVWKADGRHWLPINVIVSAVCVRTAHLHWPVGYYTDRSPQLFVTELNYLSQAKLVLPKFEDN